MLASVIMIMISIPFFLPSGSPSLQQPGKETV